jgi:hypothetical protein
MARRTRGRCFTLLHVDSDADASTPPGLASSLLKLPATHCRLGPRSTFPLGQLICSKATRLGHAMGPARFAGRRQHASQIMCRSVVTVPADATVMPRPTYCWAARQRRPGVDADGRMVSIVSEGDLMVGRRSARYRPNLAGAPARRGSGGARLSVRIPTMSRCHDPQIDGGERTPLMTSSPHAASG